MCVCACVHFDLIMITMSVIINIIIIIISSKIELLSSQFVTMTTAPSCQPLNDFPAPPMTFLTMAASVIISNMASWNKRSANLLPLISRPHPFLMNDRASVTHFHFPYQSIRLQRYSHHFHSRLPSIIISLKNKNKNNSLYSWGKRLARAHHF